MNHKSFSQKQLKKIFFPIKNSIDSSTPSDKTFFESIFNFFSNCIFRKLNSLYWTNTLRQRESCPPHRTNLPSCSNARQNLRQNNKNLTPLSIIFFFWPEVTLHKNQLDLNVRTEYFSESYKMVDHWSTCPRKVLEHIQYRNFKFYINTVSTLYIIIVFTSKAPNWIYKMLKSRGSALISEEFQNINYRAFKIMIT